MNYWREAIDAALEDAGIQATDEQREQIAGVIKVSHENYGMAFGHDVASANLQAARQKELDDAKKALQRERNKINCRECGGRGRIILRMGSLQSDSECWKCRGDGRVDP